MITNSRKIRYCQFSLFMDSIFTNSPTGWNLSVTPQINALVALLKSFRDMHRVAKFWIPRSAHSQLRPSKAMPSCFSSHVVKKKKSVVPVVCLLPHFCWWFCYLKWPSMLSAEVPFRGPITNLEWGVGFWWGEKEKNNFLSKGCHCS